MRIFCVVYRPQSHRMKYFLPDFEDLLQFSRTLKYDTILFDDFNNDTIKESKDQSDYENLITAYCVRRQNSEPTRVTPTSSTCLDHLLTGLPIKTETIKTTLLHGCRWNTYRHYMFPGETAFFFQKQEHEENQKRQSCELFVPTRSKSDKIRRRKINNWYHF